VISPFTEGSNPTPFVFINEKRAIRPKNKCIRHGKCEEYTNTTQEKVNYPSAKNKNFTVWVSEKETSLEFEQISLIGFLKRT
jgi:hypothetical protein